LAANLFLLSSRFHFFHFCFCYALSQAFSFGCLRAKEFYTWRTKAQKELETAGEAQKQQRDFMTAKRRR